MGAIGAIAAGLGVAAITGMQASRQAAQQRKAAQDAQNQQNIQMQQAQAQQQQYAQQQQLAMEADKQKADMAKAQASSIIGPEGDGSLKGAQTISTSPLGDSTDPYLGRQRILGS
jgi:hypothetical protein